MVMPSQPTSSFSLSTAEELRHHVTDLRVIPPEGLSQWLPGLAVPVGWHVAPVTLSSFPPARILVHGAEDNAGGWLGCDVINLFYFSGTTTADVIKLGTDHTLRGLGVDAPITYRVTMPAGLGVAATRSRGIAPLGPRLWVQVTNYLVTTAAGSGLIEHTLLVQARARDQLRSDVQQLSESVQTALLTGIREQTPRP